MKTKLERYIPIGYVQYQPEIGNYPKDLFTCYVNLDAPAAMFYIGKQSNYAWFNSFRTVEDMKKKINQSISSLMSWQEMKEKRKQERKAELVKVKVGELYYDSWGYDQTNIDFYQITGIRGKTFEITPIAKKFCGEAPSGGMSDNVMPVKDKFIGEPVWKRSISMKFGILFKTTEQEKHFSSWYA